MRLSCHFIQISEHTTLPTKWNTSKGFIHCNEGKFGAIAILMLVSSGVPQMIYRVLFQTLQQAKYHIKTGVERSGAVYGDEAVPISGIGQRNILGPTLWALMSTKLLRIMEKGRPWRQSSDFDYSNDAINGGLCLY